MNVIFLLMGLGIVTVTFSKMVEFKSYSFKNQRIKRNQQFVSLLGVIGFIFLVWGLCLLIF